VTIEITEAAARTAAYWLLGLLILGALLGRGESWLRSRTHRRWVDEQRRLDRQQEEDQRRLDADLDRRRRTDAPLPGPLLAGEVVRRLAYADLCDTAGRFAEAAKHRQIAGNLGALSNLAYVVGDDPDRDAWSDQLKHAHRLVGGYLPQLEGWNDPAARPEQTNTTPPEPVYAEMGTQQWVEAVAALKAAVDTNRQPHDFGPGMEGRGILTSAGAYGYAAAPELDRETVEAFLRDYCHALWGEPTEQTWPVDMPAREKWFPVRRGGERWVETCVAMRRAVDTVLHPADFRGLHGRGKSQIIAEIRERELVSPETSDRTLDDFVSDYSLAITGQAIANEWPNGTMPAVDPSRVLPLVDELQPDGFRS
jgi:hypothetical protein